jgi:hypothetical protein
VPSAVSVESGHGSSRRSVNGADTGSAKLCKGTGPIDVIYDLAGLVDLVRDDRSDSQIRKLSGLRLS